jgi:hypothetical protein
MTIPANSLKHDRSYTTSATVEKNNTALNEYVLFLSPTNASNGASVPSGAVQLGRAVTASANRGANLLREIDVYDDSGSKMSVSPVNTANLISNVGIGYNTVGITIDSIDLTVPQYLLVACINADASTVSTCRKLLINEL